MLESRTQLRPCLSPALLGLCWGRQEGGDPRIFIPTANLKQMKEAAVKSLWNDDSTRAGRAHAEGHAFLHDQLQWHCFAGPPAVAASIQVTDAWLSEGPILQERMALSPPQGAHTCPSLQLFLNQRKKM